MVDLSKLEQAARGEVLAAKEAEAKALAWGGLHPALTLIIGVTLGLLIVAVLV